MSITDRIQTVAKEKGLSIKALEKEIGLGNGTIRRWTEKSPQCDKLVMVANYLQVSLDWLVYGKEHGDLTLEEQELISAYRTAPEPMKAAARKLLDMENKSDELSTYGNGREVI